MWLTEKTDIFAGRSARWGTGSRRKVPARLPRASLFLNGHLGVSGTGLYSGPQAIADRQVLGRVTLETRHKLRPAGGAGWCPRGRLSSSYVDSVVRGLADASPTDTERPSFFSTPSDPTGPTRGQHRRREPGLPLAEPVRSQHRVQSWSSSYHSDTATVSRGMASA